MYMGIYNLQKNIFECVKVDGEYVFFFLFLASTAEKECYSFIAIFLSYMRDIVRCCFSSNT